MTTVLKSDVAENYVKVGLRLNSVCCKGSWHCVATVQRTNMRRNVFYLIFVV